MLQAIIQISPRKWAKGFLAEQKACGCRLAERLIYTRHFHYGFPLR